MKKECKRQHRYTFEFKDGKIFEVNGIPMTYYYGKL